MLCFWTWPIHVAPVFRALINYLIRIPLPLRHLYAPQHLPWAGNLQKIQFFWIKMQLQFQFVGIKMNMTTAIVISKRKKDWTLTTNAEIKALNTKNLFMVSLLSTLKQICCLKLMVWNWMKTMHKNTCYLNLWTKNQDNYYKILAIDYIFI